MNNKRNPRWTTATHWAAVCVMLAGGIQGSASAQSTPADMAGAPAVQRSTGGINYISGGAGEEERKAMDARTGEFPFKVVLSAGTGEYIVAERLSLLTSQGPVLVVRDAGPVLMIKAQPGSYTVEAVYQGRTEKRTVQIGNGAQMVGFRFPG